MNLSLYKNSKDSEGVVIDFVKILKFIKSDKLKDKVTELKEILRRDGKDAYGDAKKFLPSVTFAGVFSPSRSLETCVEYSNLIVLDVDKLSEAEMEDLRDAFSVDRNILCYFVSPSGAGLKIIVQVDSAKEDHYSAFESLRVYFLANYDVKLDPSGKDISRICYLTSDPEIYYNGQAEPFHVEVSEEQRNRVYADREVYNSKGKITTNDLKIYEVCKMWADFNCEYKEGSRNQNIFTCACNLNRCGLSLENSILSIARDRTDLPVSEIKDTCRKVYKSKEKEHNTITIVDFEKQQDASRGAMDAQSLTDLVDDLAMAPAQQLIKSGFEMRDKAFGGGKERGCAYAYVGREKTYKSVDAIKEACHLAMVENMPCLYLNGEMSKRQFLQIIAQQCLGIPRTRVSEHFAEIKEFVATKLTKLKVVTGRDFKFDSIVKTAEAFRVAIGEDVAQIFIDGIGHMEGGIDTPHLISNSKVVKEVAKSCNEGRGAAVSVLIHTDANCNYWSRKPQTFIRGKVMVLSNFDGTVGFSRFLVKDSMDEDWSDFELRKDIYNVRAEDYRTVGGEVNVVMHLNDNCAPAESADDVNLYEFSKPDKKRY